MGKKTSGKGQSKPAQEEASQETDGINLSGVFATDFPLLCEQKGLPPIGVKTSHQTEQPKEDASMGASEEGVAPPRFSVMVDYKDPDDVSTLQSLHVRGWLLSQQVITVISEALDGCQPTHLTSINLWNVGLNEQTLQQITTLAVTLKLKQLILDGNTISIAPIVELVKTTTSLEHLSLKCCSISDMFMVELSPHLSENKSITHLNLSCNHITNEGAVSLATSLRLNRTLLILALTNNKIGNQGAMALAEVISRFALNHQEIVMRRKLLSKVEEGMSQLDIEKGKDYVPRRSPSVCSVDKSGGRGAGKQDKTTKGGKKGDAKKDDKGKKDDKKKGVDAKKGKGKDAKPAGGKKGLEVPVESPKPEPTEVVNPLVSGQVEKEHDKIYLPGNTTLVYLALAYNMIEEEGIKALLQAMKVQQTYNHLGPGLLRLTLHHNSVNPGLEELRELNATLALKDPLREKTEQLQGTGDGETTTVVDPEQS